MPPSRRHRLILLLPALLAGACGSGGAGDGPGGVSAGEARALDEAAEMLEQQRLPAGTLPEAKGESPAPPPPPGDGADQTRER